MRSRGRVKLTEEDKKQIRKINEGLRKFNEALSILDQLEESSWGWASDE